jgi:hypothetical protein
LELYLHVGQNNLHVAFVATDSRPIMHAGFRVGVSAIKKAATKAKLLTLQKLTQNWGGNELQVAHSRT